MRTNFKTKTKTTPNMGRNRLHVYLSVYMCEHTCTPICVCVRWEVFKPKLWAICLQPPIGRVCRPGQTETIGFYGWARKQVGFIISLPVPGMKRGKSAGFASQSPHCPKTRQKINPMMAEQPFRLLKDWKRIFFSSIVFWNNWLYTGDPRPVLNVGWRNVNTSWSMS